MLALGTEKASEALANARAIVADSTTRAITTGFVTVPREGVRSGGTLLLVAGGTTVASITETTDMLHGVPRLIIHTSSLASKMLLRPASSLIITVIRANGTLTSSSFVASKALTLSRTTITSPFVGTFSPRMHVVRVDGRTNPSKIIRTSARRAIRTSPFSLTIKTLETLAVAIDFASTMARALILTHTRLAVTLLSPHPLTPRFVDEGRRTGGNTGRFTSRVGRHVGRLCRRLIRRLTGGFTSGSGFDCYIGGLCHSSLCTIR